MLLSPKMVELRFQAAARAAGGAADVAASSPHRQQSRRGRDVVAVASNPRQDGPRRDRLDAVVAELLFTAVGISVVAVEALRHPDLLPEELQRMSGGTPGSQTSCCSSRAGLRSLFGT